MLKALLLLLAGAASATALHLTLVDSAPREGATVAESPREILLKFNEALDTARRAITLRGASGPISVGKVRTADTASFAVSIPATLAPGEYSVAWLAGAPAHATIRGRFTFTVAERR